MRPPVQSPLFAPTYKQSGDATQPWCALVRLHRPLYCSSMLAAWVLASKRQENWISICGVDFGCLIFPVKPHHIDYVVYMIYNCQAWHQNLMFYKLFTKYSSSNFQCIIIMILSTSIVHVGVSWFISPAVQSFGAIYRGGTRGQRCVCNPQACIYCCIIKR